MGDLNFDDLIAVRVFRNGTEQELACVEQDTVGDAKELLDGKFHQKGSFQRGPLLLKSERLLELGCIYSYYFTDTGMDLFRSVVHRHHKSRLIPQAMDPSSLKAASALERYKLCGAALG